MDGVEEAERIIRVTYSMGKKGGGCVCDFKLNILQCDAKCLCAILLQWVVVWAVYAKGGKF